MQTLEKHAMATKREELIQILDKTSESDIEIVQSGKEMHITLRLSAGQSTGTQEAELEQWKTALRLAKGMWKDRPNIQKEMAEIRKECDRSFPNEGKTSYWTPVF